MLKRIFLLLLAVCTISLVTLTTSCFGHLYPNEPSDPFIKLFTKAIDGNVKIHMDDWTDVHGDIFSFLVPPEFTVKFDMGDSLECADIGFQGIIVGRILVGESNESQPISFVIEDLVNLYLEKFGDYEILESFRGYVHGNSMNIRALDFSGQLCWMVLISESRNLDSFGQGEFLVFIGLVERNQTEQWADWYTGMLITLLELR